MRLGTCVSDEPIRTKEHSTFEVAADRFFIDGKLQLYEETQQKNYFQIRARGSKLVLQAGGFIGLIPVNDKVTIEVAPRTPINNLDRMLRIAGVESAVITRIRRSYGETDENLSLMDVLADELVAALEQIALEGRMKTYEHRRFVGAPRSGRVLVSDTLRARATHSGKLTVVSSRFERTANNVFNAVLKVAIERIVSDIRGGKPRKGWRARLRGLNEGWQMFASVDGRLTTRVDVENIRARLADGSSPAYRRALAVAVAVLSERSPSLMAGGGPLALTSVIYNLSVAFEDYVRNVLRLEAELGVHDGNQAPPAGAGRKLFSQPATADLAKMVASPDIILGPPKTPWVAADVKYKIFGDAPDREDLNQVLTYAIAYDVDKCLLIYPAGDSLKGLLDCGSIGSKRVYCYGIDLKADDLAAEESAMKATLLALCPLDS